MTARRDRPKHGEGFMTDKIIDITKPLRDKMIERLGAVQRSPKETTKLMFEAGMELRMAAHDISKDWDVQETLTDYLAEMSGEETRKKSLSKGRHGVEVSDEYWNEDGEEYSEAAFDFMSNLVVESCAYLTAVTMF